MNTITAIVLAAGQSRRMGQPKMLLPWGGTTVLGQVASTLAAAELGEIVVVTGGARQAVEAEIARLAAKLPVRGIHNPGYAQEGMISSIQCGLRAMTPGRRAALVALGDQPQTREGAVRRIVAAFAKTGAALVVPSYRMQRGHPWLVSRALWPDLLALSPAQTGRDFLHAHTDQILYLPVEDDSILRDLDTPEDYERQRPT